MLKLNPTDLILYSAKVIPGNDTRVMQVRGCRGVQVAQEEEEGRWEERSEAQQV